MIGSTFQGSAVGAVIGPAHSSLIPDVMWGGWLDSGLVLLGMTGATVSHDAFDVVGTGVENIALIDAGDLPAGTIAHFGLFDDAAGTNVIAYAAVDLTGLSAGDPVAFDAGALTFPYTEA